MTKLLARPEPRVVVIDELRHVELEPGPGAGPWIQAAVNTVVLAGVSAGIYAVSKGGAWYAFGLPLVGALRGIVIAKDLSPFGRRVAMRIEPWGFVLDPEGKPEVLPWPRISQIRHRTVAVSEDSSVEMFFVEVDGRTYRAVCPASAPITVLPVAFAGYVAAAKKPVALDLDGAVSIEGTQATFAELLGRARRMLESPEGAAQLGMPAAGYRGVASRTPGHETASILRGALVGHRRAVDEGPLAAMLAAMLRTRELLSEVLTLCMSPSPFVAAVGKAAALRLGAAPMQPGAVEEVLPFLPVDEVRAIERFARGEDGG
ncbi:hypothetical protein [Polyangium jinanense]|uniref:Uncharacterized protein n=1 Tax=Polyangium jinanense TaxID=2829994 RepID=A0A9X3X6A3_9BACT|nr:hypothetical protein [Polyangium jinanense]MDC3958022.1 hypothetical protein [Polyangium jinanense]MDC3983575.1 hypothetical protein [Polyangium jinanense]